MAGQIRRTIKISINGDVRRALVDIPEGQADAKLKAIHVATARCFAVEETELPTLTWMRDGNQCTLADDTVEDMLMLAGVGPLRLFASSLQESQAHSIEEPASQESDVADPAEGFRNDGAREASHQNWLHQLRVGVQTIRSWLLELRGQLQEILRRYREQLPERTNGSDSERLAQLQAILREIRERLDAFGEQWKTHTKEKADDLKAQVIELQNNAREKLGQTFDNERFQKLESHLADAQQFLAETLDTLRERTRAHMFSHGECDSSPLTSDETLQAAAAASEQAAEQAIALVDEALSEANCELGTDADLSSELLEVPGPRAASEAPEEVIAQQMKGIFRGLSSALSQGSHLFQTMAQSYLAATPGTLAHSVGSAPTSSTFGENTEGSSAESETLGEFLTSAANESHQGATSEVQQGDSCKLCQSECVTPLEAGAGDPPQAVPATETPATETFNFISSSDSELASNFVQLTAMGFPEDQVKEALVVANGNKEQAVECLLRSTS